jgi:hypothetical protein
VVLSSLHRLHFFPLHDCTKIGTNRTQLGHSPCTTNHAFHLSVREIFLAVQDPLGLLAYCQLSFPICAQSCIY